MGYDNTLAERIKEALTGVDDLTEKEKMGGLSFMIGKKVLIRIEGNELVVRCKPQETEMLSQKDHVRRYQMKGKPQMKGWLVIAPEGIRTDDALGFWVEVCIDFYRSNRK